MITKKIALFLITITTLCLSCNKIDDISFKELKIETKNAEKNIFLSKISTNPSYVKLHTDSVFLIGQIFNIKYYKKIYVHNFQKILVFNKKGYPVYRIDSQGKAGSEYFEINDFYVDTLKNTLEVWDRVKRKMFIYNDSTGEFIKSYTLDLDALCFRKLENNYFFYSNAAYAEKGKEVSQIFILGNDRSVKKEFLKSDYVKLYHFNTPGFLSVNDNIVFYDEAPLSQIWEITENSCRLAYKLNIDNNTMSKDEYISMRNLHSSERFRKLWDNYTFSLGETNVNNYCIKTTIRSKSKAYYCFYNQKNDHYFLSGNICDDFNLNIPVLYTNICNNKLICQIPAHKLINSEIDYEVLAKVNPELYKMISGLNKFDNPVLIISDLKEF